MDDNPIDVGGLLPSDRSSRFYERAKLLFQRGGGTSVELELIIRDVSAASAYSPNEVKYYFFLAKVFQQSLDFASAIFCLRNALRLDGHNRLAKDTLAEIQLKRGQECMGEAINLQREASARKNPPAKLINQYKGLYQIAVVYFQASLEIDRDNYKTQMFKAVCHIHANQLHEALELLNRSIHLIKGKK